MKTLTFLLYLFLNGRRISELNKKGVIPIYSHRPCSIKRFSHQHNPSDELIKKAADPLLLSSRLPFPWKSHVKQGVIDIYTSNLNRWVQLLKLQNSNEKGYLLKSAYLFRPNYDSDPNTIPYTQGFMFSGEYTIIESAGMYMGSLLREFSTLDGSTLRYIRLPDTLFAEGIAFLNIKWNEFLKSLTALKEFKSFPVKKAESVEQILLCTKVGSLCSYIKESYISEQLFILQLTWKENIAVLYNYTSFLPIITFHFPYDGWGLTSNYQLNKVYPNLEEENVKLDFNIRHEEKLKEFSGSNKINNLKIWATTGKNILLEIDTQIIIDSIVKFILDINLSSNHLNFSKYALIDLTATKIIHTSCWSRPLYFLNELEYDFHSDSIFANHYGTLHIYEIDTITGECKSVINLDNLEYPKNDAFKNINNVMNGISIKQNESISGLKPTFYITGKRWREIYSFYLNN